MGMTWEQYWDEPPHLAIAYRKAHRLRREIENEQAWIQGLYMYDAFAVCLANAFAKRGSKRHDYIDKPIDIYPLTEEEKKRREQEEYAKMQEAMETMVRQQRQQREKQGD